MFQCQDCGAKFTEVRPGVEYYGECHGRPVYAPGAYCPVCGGPPQDAGEEEYSTRADKKRL